jgi:glycosyltransferase involved in cell wall biosynthesis
MLRVLITSDYYLPAAKAGGAVRSLANLVEALGDELDFRIVTRDRDAGDARPFAGVAVERWQRVGKAQVYYLSAGSGSLARWRRLLRATPHDVCYLNSFFSPTFTLKPLLLRRLGLVPPRPVVLSPRGELAASALAIKARKKRWFAPVARALALYRNVIWQASSQHEADDIRRQHVATPRRGLFIVPDLCAAVAGRPSLPKRPGALSIAFLARIAPIKNLEGALTMLSALNGDVEFSIYGPVEGAAYWGHCQNIIAALPPNVRVHYRGAVPSEEVPGILSRHHLLFLPTKGENYGHAIVEALAAGCPVLISDRTPWRRLAEHNAGWDLPLERPELFRDVLRRAVEMDESAHQLWSRGARAFYQRLREQDQSLLRHRELFQRAAAASVIGGK